MDLQGKHLLITGGAHRLGRAVGMELARRGADVAFTYYSSHTAAQQTEADIRALGVDVLSVRADAADPQDAAAMVKATVARFKTIDAWLACAGVFRRTPADQVDQTDWQDMMRGNYETFRVPAGPICEIMQNQGSGNIIAFADVAAIRPWLDYIPYCVSKSCVLHHARELARRLAPKIRVNSILPGPVLFPPSYPEEAKRSEIDNTLLKREGSADDIARAVAFLLENDYLTGIALPVDGGRLLK